MPITRYPSLITSEKAVTLFNNSEEVKVSVRCEPRARACAFVLDRELGLIVSRIQHTKGLNAANTSSL
jgi:hypothetical protein